MKIVILLHEGVKSANGPAALALARSSRGKGHEVTIFAMSEGVTHLASKDFCSLVDDGVALTICEHNRKEYEAPEGVDQVTYGSQFDLAGYIQDADRVISFAPGV